MKALFIKLFIVSYTLFIAAGATALLLFSVKVDNYAETYTPENQVTQSIKKHTWDEKIPTGPFYEEIEYNEPFTINEIFTDVVNEDIAVTHTSYDSKKLGHVPITVTFTNNQNDSTTRLLILNIIDTIAPKIEAEDVTIFQGEIFDKAAYVKATDNVDGDLSKNIEVEGDVNTQVIGTYDLRYRVKDKSNNIGNEKQTVSVVAKPVAEENLQEVYDYSDSSPIDIQTTPAENSVSEEAPPPVHEEQANVPTAAPAEVPKTPAYQPNTLYIAGVPVPYQNVGVVGGQGVIDSNPNGTAATWGGAAVQSGSDGLNTHFIGHNPGIFSVILSLGIGSSIIVTDGSGQPTTYIVNGSIQVDDYAMDSNGTNYWDRITGAGGGERISLQTCITDSTNLIIFASA